MRSRARPEIIAATSFSQITSLALVLPVDKVLLTQRRVASAGRPGNCRPEEGTVQCERLAARQEERKEARFTGFAS